MNKYDELKVKIADCAPITMANLMLLRSEFLLEAFSNADCILIDKEHGLYDTERLAPLTHQCRVLGIPTIVRVEDSQYSYVAKSIDMGADGIMLPRTESVEQVKTAVEAMHLAPVGRTGFGGWGILRENETIAQFQNNRFLFVQIESAKGLAEMENMIAAYDDWIDAFIIGPNDYSITMGVPRQLDHPIMMEEYRKFYDICKKHHKSCGIFDPDVQHAERDHRMGANIFWIGDDFSYVKAGFDQMVTGISNFLK